MHSETPVLSCARIPRRCEGYFVSHALPSSIGYGTRRSTATNICVPSRNTKDEKTRNGFDVDGMDPSKEQEGLKISMGSLCFDRIRMVSILPLLSSKGQNVLIIIVHVTSTDFSCFRSIPFSSSLPARSASFDLYQSLAKHKTCHANNANVLVGASIRHRMNDSCSVHGNVSLLRMSFYFVHPPVLLSDSWR